MKTPLVSIIIPAYNKAELTVKTVKSALNQDYPHIEILVVDDGSTDSTQKDLECLKGSIKYIFKGNGGACSARNYGINESKGEFIAFLDCDDLYLPSKISQSLRYFEQNPQTGMVHTAAYFIDEADQLLGSYDHRRSRKTGLIAQSLVRGNFICNSTIVVRRECLKTCGMFDESIFSPADWDLWLRIAEKFPVGYIAQPGTKYRVTGNYILRNIEKAKTEERLVLEKFFQRNKSGALQRKKLISDFHLRYAQCYFVNRQNEFKNEFLLSLKQNPFNLKGLGCLLGYFLLPRQLETILKRKIVRDE